MKKFYLLCFIFLTYNSYSQSLNAIEFDTEISITKNKKFSYHNKKIQPILIKIHQNHEIKLEIYNGEEKLIVDTPGHRAIPEFLVIDAGESVSFKIIPTHIIESDIFVKFEKIPLNNFEYEIWTKQYLAVLDFAKGDFKTAGNKFLHIANQLELRTNHLKTQCLFMAAVSFNRDSQYEKSLALLETVIKTGDHLPKYFLAVSLNYKAIMQSILGQKNKAIALFNQSLNVFLQINDKEGHTSTLNEIGLSYHSLGELDIALEYYNKALIGFQTLKHSQNVARQYINIGGVFYMKGMNIQAEVHFNKAMEISTRIKDKKNEAYALEMLAWLQQSQGDYNGLITKWYAILNMREVLKDKIGITRAYKLIGDSYLSYGSNKKALEFFNKSLANTNQNSKTGSYSKLLNSFANAYFNLNDLDLSEDYFKKALQHKSANNELSAASNYMGLAKINLIKSSINDPFNSQEMIQKRIDKASSLIDHSISIYKNSDNQLNLPKAKLVKAELLLVQSRFDESFSLVKESLILAEKNNDLVSKIQAQMLQGEILLKTNKTADAINVFKSVLTNANKQRIQIINPKYRATYSAYLENTRNLLVNSLVLQYRETSLEFYLQEALNVSESGKAKSLNELINQSDSIPFKNNENINELQNQLKTLYFLRSELQNKSKFEMTEHKRLNSDIQETLFKLDVEFELNTSITHKDLVDEDRFLKLQKAMKPDSLYIAMRLTDDVSYVWHIYKDKIVLKEIPKKSDIEYRVEILYDFFKNSRYGLKTFPNTIESSNNWLIENVFVDIDFNNIKKLVISPHGKIQSLPIMALKYQGSKISDMTNLSFTPSLLMSHKKQYEVNNNQKYLIVANPNFIKANAISKNKNVRDITYRGNSFEHLKFTKQEADFISKLVGVENVDLYEANHATKSNILLNIEKQYQLMHFATHGIVDPQIPEISGLVLSSNGTIKDNILTINEIINLNIKTNTIVLSACETAIGETIREEGIIGLSYAFLAAGAQEVYATLWKIGDRSTLKSIKKMYAFKKITMKLDLKISDPFWVKYEIL